MFSGSVDRSHGHCMPAALPRGLFGFRRRRRPSSLKRLFVESMVELLNAPLAEVHAAGPGLTQFPMSGPALVIANHPTYLDPIWMMKVLPREATGMMIDRYYKLPVVHWAMNVMRVIPVEWSEFRRTAPELDEAIRRLDRGEVVLMFPEGWVRRKAEEPLRKFAQGAWRILRERPTTPVVAGWIAGGWGGWASFARGPFRGVPDWRRPIHIGLAAPRILDAATLANSRTTREELMRMCRGAGELATDEHR